MKKSIITLLSLLALTLTGCEKLNASDGRGKMDQCMMCEKINRHGHSYLVFWSTMRNGIDVIHDPDCSCREKGE